MTAKTSYPVRFRIDAVVEAVSAEEGGHAPMQGAVRFQTEVMDNNGKIYTGPSVGGFDDAREAAEQGHNAITVWVSLMSAVGAQPDTPGLVEAVEEGFRKARELQSSEDAEGQSDAS